MRAGPSRDDGAMRITGLVVTTADVAATSEAWERLGVDLAVEIVSGDPGLTAVVLAVEDVAATERLLQRRGLSGDAGGFDLGGTTWRLAPASEARQREGLALDHVVVTSGDAVRAAADFGARLGLDLRLDRHTDFGYQGLFLRCADAIVEVVVPQNPPSGRDAFSGLAWRCEDIAATRARLVDAGVEVSELRRGRKPGTTVATVRDRDLAVPTLLIGPVAD